MPHKLLNSGQMLILLIIAVVILGAGFMVGGFVFKQPKTFPDSSVESNMCCDSGDGNSCKPSETKTFEWKGTNAQSERYGLIKSRIQLLEGSGHLELAQAPDDKTPDGKPIFLNVTNKGASASYCHDNSVDRGSGIDSVGGGGCLPNDEIIYVCTNCQANVLPDGTGGEFDAYYRLNDGDVPDVIRNCSKAPVAITGGAKVNEFKAVKDENLQLQTLTFSSPDVSVWLSPWCKPAVYLYPDKTTLVSVKINSTQPLTYTNPIYPPKGWSVIADAQGIITYQNKPYDYLYYETKIADNILKKPEKGYVVKPDELKKLFSNILPKLGLNIRESKQFSDYWAGVLPPAAYYFVGIVPQNELSNYANLEVNPKPATEIRVTLYFEALDDYIEVEQPIILTPERTGFTVVEWGGIYKKHTDENFSCFL